TDSKLALEIKEVSAHQLFAKSSLLYPLLHNSLVNNLDCTAYRGQQINIVNECFRLLEALVIHKSIESRLTNY
ncbi:hypothetical protein M8C21_000384, partial [Ambrosia artemisiifolia]